MICIVAQVQMNQASGGLLIYLDFNGNGIKRTIIFKSVGDRRVVIVIIYPWAYCSVMVTLEIAV